MGYWIRPDYCFLQPIFSNPPQSDPKAEGAFHYKGKRYTGSHYFPGAIPPKVEFETPNFIPRFLIK